MYKDPTYEAVKRSFEKISSGETYENAIRNIFIDYCKAQGMIYANTVHTDEDTKKGTDLIIAPGTKSDLDLFDLTDFITAKLDGMLRIDITHNFSHKNNVPLLWQLEDEITVNNKPLQVGIRVANGTAGFDNPVVVIGTNDNSGRFDINSAGSGMYGCISDKIQTLFYEAGCALATYYKCTSKNPEENMWAQPERLAPNYDRQYTFRTHDNKKTLYKPALQLAANLAQRDINQGKNVKEATDFLDTSWIPRPTIKPLTSNTDKNTQALKTEYARLCEPDGQDQQNSTPDSPAD